MKFTTVNSNGQAMCTYIDCIPFDDIEQMAKAGYKFKLDGKVISKSAVIAMQPTIKHSVDTNPADTNTSNTASTNNKSRAVRCVDTGEVFNNQSAAAKHFNIDPAQVSDSIKTGRPRSGYTFEKVEL